ncbi:MAG: hypothetical protein ACREMZ_05810 [Gemmatimonadales bacterium]
MKWHRRFLVLGLTLALLAGASCTAIDSTPTEAPLAEQVEHPSQLLGLFDDLGDAVDGTGDALGDAVDDVTDTFGGDLGDAVDNTVGGAIAGVLAVTDLLTCKEQKYVVTRATIGPEGGVIDVGTHTLSIPKGALRKKTAITAEQMKGSTNSVRFSPQGLRFVKSAKLTMSYKNCTVVLLPKSIVYTTEKFKILEVLRSIDLFNKKTVTAPIDHFSRYAVAY